MDISKPAPSNMGRPRLYDPEAEVKMLVDSAWSLLRSKPYKDMTITDILSTSGLSTRSFYRHFASKDDALWFIYRREEAALAEIMQNRIARASGPVEALIIWVDTLLALAYTKEAAERTTILRAAVRQIDPRFAPPRSEGTALFVEILTNIIARGRSEGHFPRAEPEADAWSVNALLWDLIDALAAGQDHSSRSKARKHILKFSLSALGFDETNQNRGRVERPSSNRITRERRR